tara:strand:+ start:897 stop:1184 length:288 start_codon:yes stop_codon:yes gene_type:complete
MIRVPTGHHGNLEAVSGKHCAVSGKHCAGIGNHGAVSDNLFGAHWARSFSVVKINMKILLAAWALHLNISGFRCSVLAHLKRAVTNQVTDPRFRE